MTRIATIDFHITARCSQACPYCWGPRRFRKTVDNETALSITGDRLTPEILSEISPFLDLISLPLDGSSEEVNARTKRPGHFSAIMHVLDWLREYPAIDVKVCTPVTRHNLGDLPAIVHLDEALEASQFDSPKHLRHSREWAKRMIIPDDME